MIDDSVNKYFRSPDTPLAVYLITEGFSIVDLAWEKGNGKSQAFFLFEDSAQLRELVRLYNRGEAKVNISLYDHTKKTLLDRIRREMP
jgi:hypothetical protein